VSATAEDTVSMAAEGMVRKENGIKSMMDRDLMSDVRSSWPDE